MYFAHAGERRTAHAQRLKCRRMPRRPRNASCCELARPYTRQRELSSTFCLGDHSSSAQRLLDGRSQQHQVEDIEGPPHEGDDVAKTVEDVDPMDEAELGLSLVEHIPASMLSLDYPT